MIQFSFSHRAELSDCSLSVLTYNNNQSGGVAPRTTEGLAFRYGGTGGRAEEDLSAESSTGNSAPGRSLPEAVSSIWFEKQL